ncbi:MULTISPECIES: type VI secretion system contractile sheath small subunit [Pseudomonas]|jgi:type VI secretion system protein ImpB|uniref:type VI secretion system contractile sheath small subunit n=1 Tax=Pseudomonas TaxID=286 RepID=UPI0002A44A2D|nr:MULTISPECIES: type VI secretion system contractile sheath small subunit [Pseudomonas]MBB1605559.1 type VI secretion system-associated protein [Pseudomonas sp. UMC76]MBB1640014.1 type VI secretion system-associated protein [Pseudomonas sp. UME83]NTY22319.1 type VI secretion system contractile sheath small subunit [Pseudomonas sp. UMC3103]NTY28333.1 type VI secretion system contractile sheath small subunit [Pseudomonas sp. UMA603]NTY34661.1 type VI secretion system contractile sheath small su
MAQKEGSVAPKERINIKYVPATGGQQEEIELPLKLMVTGDFKGHEEATPLEDRAAVRIDKDNFNDVMEKAGLALTMDVPSVLEGSEGDTLKVDLMFSNIKDFSPDAIARQVPELNKLLELREALVALKGPMGNIPAFRKQLQTLLGDEAARSKLSEELEVLLGASES